MVRGEISILMVYKIHGGETVCWVKGRAYLAYKKMVLMKRGRKGRGTARSSRGKRSKWM